MVKNTAGQKIGAQMVSATDGSAFTGAVTVAVTVDAGTQATGSVGSGACTHEGNGYHTYAPAQAETNGTLIAFTFTGTGAVPATVQVFTTGYDPTAAQVPANITQISGDSTAADNLEAAADGTGYNLGGGAVVAASVTGNVGGNVTGSVGSVAAGGITASSLAADAITAAKIAADVSAEIADAVWEEAIADHSGTAGSTAEALNAAGSAGDPWTTALPGSYTGSQAGKMLSDILTDTGTTLQGELDGIQADTEDIQARLPAALVAGRIDASVGAMAADVLTASALAASAVTEIQSGLSTLDAVGVRTAVGLASANLDTQLDALPTAAENADAVWDESTTGHTTSGTFGEQVKTDVDAILVDTAEIGAAGAGLTEAGGTGDQLTAVPWNASWDAEVQSEVADALEEAVADSIPADGSRPSVKQALYMLTQFMVERSVSSTTVTVKKPDGSTSLFTLTLNDATSPTSITRAS
jgi:hypothetical protein